MQDWARPVAAEAARTRRVVSCMLAGGFLICRGGVGGSYSEACLVFKMSLGVFGNGGDMVHRPSLLRVWRTSQHLYLFVFASSQSRMALLITATDCQDIEIP